MAMNFGSYIAPPNNGGMPGTGAFNLKGSVKYYRDLCRCQQPKAAQYFTNFSANIGIPEGGTEQTQISVAFALDGVTIPGTTMQAPGTVGVLYSVSAATNIPVLKSCCQTLTVRNTSSVPITVNNPNIDIMDDATTDYERAQIQSEIDAIRMRGVR